MKLAFFAFDDGEWLRGWTLGQRWNGWGCPYFDAEQLPAVLREFARLDYAVVQHEDGAVSLQHVTDDEEYVFAPRTVDGKRVWSFEGYTWNERDAEPSAELDEAVDLAFTDLDW